MVTNLSLRMYNILLGLLNAQFGKLYEGKWKTFFHMKRPISGKQTTRYSVRQCDNQGVIILLHLGNLYCADLSRRQSFYSTVESEWTLNNFLTSLEARAWTRDFGLAITWWIPRPGVRIKVAGTLVKPLWLWGVSVHVDVQLGGGPVSVLNHEQCHSAMSSWPILNMDILTIFQ